MNLDATRWRQLRRSLQVALNQEWPQLDRTQRRLATLPVTRITAPENQPPTLIVATVATDGGECRLSLEPIRVQIVRVADSQGIIYFEDFIPLSLAPDEIVRFFFKAEPRLRKFLEWLGVDRDALLPASDFQRSQLLEMMRELMEWAALLKLASQPRAKLLVRDGLLRSGLLPAAAFQRLRDRFAAFTGKHGHLLAGVAKRSRVIKHLSVALGLGESFAALLRESARNSFPVRGYPHALIQAHAHAHLGGLEVEMLEQSLLDEVAARNPAVATQARRLRLLGRQLAEEITAEPPAS